MFKNCSYAIFDLIYFHSSSPSRFYSSNFVYSFIRKNKTKKKKNWLRVLAYLLEQVRPTRHYNLKNKQTTKTKLSLSPSSY